MLHENEYFRPNEADKTRKAKRSNSNGGGGFKVMPATNTNGVLVGNVGMVSPRPAPYKLVSSTTRCSFRWYEYTQL